MPTLRRNRRRLRHTATRRLATACLSVLLAAASPAGATSPEGAESPEALMARLKATGENEDVAGVVACIVPEERALFAFIMAMIPIEMMNAVLPRMAKAQGTDSDIGAKTAKFEKTYEALLAKYGVARVSPDTELDMSDPAASARVLNEKFGHIDHAAFVVDAMAILDEIHPQSDDPASPAEPYRAEVASIEVDGDQALVRFESVDDSVRLVRRGDRWFMRLVPPGY
jgi:hypothetical protein